MIRPLLLLAALLCAMPATAADRRFAVTDFERIVVEGPFTVLLTTGRPTSAVASGDRQAVDSVSVEVQGGILRIRRNPNWTGSAARTAAPPATVALTTRTLRTARVVGSGRLTINGLRGQQVERVVEGSGRISAGRVAADQLGAGVRGSGTIELSGTAGIFRAEVQGSGSLLGDGFTADAATISAATSGDVRLAARRTAMVTASGVGAIRVDGSAACTVRGPNAAEVSCGSAR